MLSARIFYAFFYGAMAALAPFLSIYYKRLGLPGGRIGLLLAITPLVVLLAAPLWGSLADSTRRHKRLLLLAIAGAAVGAGVLGSTRDFGWLVLVVFGYSVFVAPIIPLVDNAVMSLLGDQPGRYGRIRLWGAVGWGIAAPLTGWWVGRSGLSWAFYVYIALMLAGLVAAWRLPMKAGPVGGSYLRSLRRFLADRRWIFFLMLAFVAGVSVAVLTNYLYLYLDQLHASQFLMGLSLTISTLSELPAFFFSAWLIERLTARRVILFSMLIFAVRCWLYAAVRQPLWVLPIQLLHGLTFSALWAAGVSYAAEIAPAGLGATAQGLFSGVVMGLGSAAGALLGGFLYQLVGASAMFRVIGLVALVFVAVFWLAERRSLKKNISSIKQDQE